jgi:6-phosphogluconolactonase (cycloisomerase 2 family)
MKIKAIILAIILVLAASTLFVGCSTSAAPTQVALFYMVGQGSNSISGSKLLSSGQLTPLSLSAFATNPRPVSMVLHPSKSFIYVANLTANTVSGYNLDRTTGVLTPIGTAVAPSPVGTGPIVVGVSGDGLLLFVLNQGSANISVFSIDTARGFLTEVAGSPFPTVANPQFMVVAPSAKQLYVANGTLSTISGFTFSASGTLSAIAGSPFSAGAGANVAGMAIDTKGQFLYAADSANNKVVSFSIASGTGVLAPVAGSPVAAHTTPVAVAVDSTGAFLYASNQGSDDVSAYKINGGALTEVSGSPFTTKATSASTAAQPGYITVDVTNTFVCVGNVNAKTVTIFSINAADGTLIQADTPSQQVIAPLWILTTN